MRAKGLGTAWMFVVALCVVGSAGTAVAGKSLQGLAGDVLKAGLVALGKNTLYLCEVTKPDGSVSIDEMTGDEVNSRKEDQKAEYKQALTEWAEGYKSWAQTVGQA